MQSKQSKLIALALVGACAVGAYSLGSALLGDDEAEAAKDLINRPWIERVPEDSRDMIGHLAVIDHPQGHFGATGRSSNWRHFIEVFKWQLRGDELQLYFPQEEARGAVKVRTWACEGEAPKPFDLCLEIKARNGRAMTLYSRHDWEIRPGHAQEDLAALADEQPILRGMVDDPDENQLDLIEALDLDEAEDWSVRDLF